LTLLSLLVLAVACLPEPPPPRPPSYVYAFTSTDLVRWTAQPEPVAEKLESLGLSVRPDGELWLTGLDMSGQHNPLRAKIIGPALFGRRFDGERWVPETWWFKDPDAVAFIDPQMFEDGLWYVSRKGTHGDPAKDTQPNDIRSTPPAQTRLSGVGLVDPNPVRFRGALLLFVTDGHNQVSLFTGEPLQKAQTFNNVSVPFAFVHNDTLYLVAQRPINGRRQPVMSKSDDGVQFTEFMPLLTPELVRTCTSPVIGPLNGGWILLCVDEGVEGVAAEGQPPRG
jgi:hypothetical protein